MAEMTFKFEDATAKKILTNLAKGFTDFKPALEQAEKYQLRQVPSQFETEGDHITGRWAALKKRTIQQRVAAGFGPGPILTRTGKLKRSFGRKSLDKNKLEITSRNNYYPYHQLGTRKMPQRQILGHSDRMISDVVEIMAAYIKKLLLA